MKPDIQLKKFFEHDDRFLSLFNAYFYHGESVIKEEYLSPDDSEVVKLVASNHIAVIRRMIKFNLNADQAMDALSIDEKDRDFYREKLASLSKN